MEQYIKPKVNLLSSNSYSLDKKTKKLYALKKIRLEHEDEGIRQRIAYNKKTKSGILKILSRDKCESVSEAASERLKSLNL